MRPVYLISLFSITLVAGACSRPEPPPVPESTAELMTAADSLWSGLDIAGFDFDVRPQDDFFEFANGAWLRATEIPSDRADYGSFTKLSDEAENHLLEILDELAARPEPEPGSSEQLIRDFHRSLAGYDGPGGISALENGLVEIRAIDNHAEVWRRFPANLAAGGGAPLAAFVNQDAGDATRYVLYLNQSGLTLPDRDYYLEDSSRYIASREMLVDYAATLFEFAGEQSARERAGAVLDIETRLAEAQWTRVQNRNPVATYNPFKPSDLDGAVPGLPWDDIHRGLDLPELDVLIIRQPEYLQALPAIVEEFQVAAWRDWLSFKLLDSYAAWLGPDWFEAHFSFHQQGLRGVPEPRPLERRILETLNGRVGFALGELYVERHFRPEARQRMEDLVANLKTALNESLTNLEWMTEDTRSEALDKLAGFNTKIGYPDVWRDYTGLEVRPDDPVGNLMRSIEFEYRRNLSRLGQPINRDEWFMTPQTVNAYYSPLMNEIVFPAAILQPPFFDMAADDAVNYGAIGAVIGHELGHGFDDSGRRFDGRGNLRDWWTEQDAAEYERRAEILVEQYNLYNPIDDLHVDGRLTLGENIGDLGGMTIAWRAYQLALDGDEPPVIDGYTGAQRFFLGWAQIWRRKYQDEELRRRLRTDTHSPARYRVNGVVRNMPAFYEAFQLEPADGLWLDPEERVEIW